MKLFTSRDGLEEQPSKTPTRKVALSGLAGLVIVIVLSIVGELGVEIPGVVTEDLPVGEAFTGIIMWFTAYMARERA